jgi:adenylate kinase
MLDKKGPDNTLNIVLLGRSGSGKGTQAKFLCDKFDLEYIGSGDLLREFSNRNLAVSRRLKKELAEGKLMPTWIPFYLWLDKLVHLPEDKGILFDGSPRKVAEAEMLEDVLEWFERKNVKAILIEVSRDEAYKRMISRRICIKCGNISSTKTHEETDIKCEKCKEPMHVRPGDHPDAIEARLDWFDKETQKSIDFYEKKGILIKINGEQSIEDVSKEILEKLGNK